MTLARSARITLATLAAALAGCGGTGARDGGSATTSGATAPVAAHADPQRVLAQAAAALRSVRSFHVDATDRGPDGNLSFAGDVTTRGDLTMTVHQYGTSAQLRVARGIAFMRAPARFWRASHMPERVTAAIAGRWFRVPPGGPLYKLSDDVRPATMAHCIRYGTSGLADAGVRTLHRQRVRVITSDGRAPGSAPGKLFLTATGRILPVRAVQTGRERPGGKVDPRCEDPQQPDRSTYSDIRLSRYDEPVSVTAPRGALDLRSVVARVRGTTSS